MGRILMLVCHVLLVGLFLVVAAPSQSANQSTGIVHAALEEMVTGYLRWEHQHPEAIQSGKPLMLAMPSIDLYSPAGVSLHHGSDSEKNAAFIRALPQTLREARTDEVRPSLKEAIEMFAELKTQEVALLSNKEYTVFALTYADTDLCKAQNDSIEKLRGRAHQLGVRILEVRLHK
jgi:hypothetical protein